MSAAQAADASVMASVTASEGGGIAVTGAVTFATAGGLLQSGRGLFAGQQKLVVDLAGVTRVDSAGLALLLEWLRQARSEGRTVTFTGLPEKLLAIARLSGVDGLLVAGETSPR